MTLPTTDRHGLPLLSAGQAQKEVAHNEALLIADFAMNPVAESLGLENPPDPAETGKAWIVGSEPAGAWAGRAGQVACRTAGGWRFLVPFEGLCVRLSSNGLSATWTGGGWTAGIVKAAELRIADLKVVGERRGAIADPSGGAVADDQARSAIASVLAALRSHGLIST